MTEKPFPDSYWVVPDEFLAGGYPGSSQGDETFTHQRLAALLEAGFNTFIDLTRPGEAPAYPDALNQEAARFGTQVDYQNEPVEDRGLPTVEQMLRLLDKIDAALAAERKVYLHCLGGIGRTGTVVGCWLARHGLTGEAALARLNSLYRASEQSHFFAHSPEQDAQALFILDWKEAAPPQTAAISQALPEQENGPQIDWHARFRQQAGWTRALRAYLYRRAGMAQATRVLEAGCGTGAVLSDLATRATVYGLDLDGSRLAQAHLHADRAVLTCGNALRLPYASGSFDITFCHFLLLWVPDPLQALREMRRVTRPGGSVLAMAEPDYDKRVDKPRTLIPLGRWQTESLRRQGADPGVGARLAELFEQAGIPLVEAGRLGETGAARPTPEERDLEWAVLESDLKGIVQPAELRRLKNLDEQAWKKGERILSVPTHYAWGRLTPMV